MTDFDEFVLVNLAQVLDKGFADDDDLADFRKWAFGEGITSDHLVSEHMDAWNLFHQEEYELKDTGIIQDDIKEMIKLYKDRK